MMIVGEEFSTLGCISDDTMNSILKLTNSLGR